MSTVIFDTLKKNILDVLFDIEPSQITESSSLECLGANSMDRVDIVTLTCEALSVHISLKDLAKANNIAELVIMLEAAYANSTK